MYEHFWKAVLNEETDAEVGEYMRWNSLQDPGFPEEWSSREVCYSFRKDCVTDLRLHKVKLSCTRVHHGVKVLVTAELGLNQTADVSLKHKHNTDNEQLSENL